MGTLCVITDSQITSRKIIQRRHLVLGISLPQFVLCKTIYSRTGMGKQDQPHNIGTSRVQDETNFMERFFILFLIFLRWSIIERLERAYHHHKFFHTRTQHHPWSLNKLRNLYQTMHLASHEPLCRQHMVFFPPRKMGLEWLRFPINHSS